MTDVKQLGQLNEGDVVALNGRQLVVDDVRYDSEGNAQITLYSAAAIARRKAAGIVNAPKERHA